MNRKTIDSLVSYIGLALAVVLLGAGILASVASSFVNEQVTNQLTEQKITMPTKEAVAAQKFAQADADALAPYSGLAMTTGDQAYAFAEHYIKVHMAGIAGGKTYEEVSSEYMAALKTAPTAPETAALGQQRMSLFMGDTLRGLLLNAYAFGTVGKIAGFAAIGAYIAAGVLLLLSFLGFRHARRVE